MDKKVELGDRVEDVITGLQGIASGITDWLYGCRRVTVQPEQSKDGKPIETFCVDEPQLVVLGKNAISSIEELKSRKRRTTGGPRPDAEPRPNAAR